MTIVVIIQYTTKGKAGDLGTYVAVTASGRQEGRHPVIKKIIDEVTGLPVLGNRASKKARISNSR
jgi:hypothetical protein